MRKDIRILIVEDRTLDVPMAKEMLQQIEDFAYNLTTAGTLAEALHELSTKEFDVILLDLDLPDCRGIETFRAISSQCSRIPIIVLAQELEESTAIEALRYGAQNYHVKSEIDGADIVKSIIYAIERNALRIELEMKTIALQKSEERFRMIVEKNKDAFLILNEEGRIQFTNPAAVAFFGQTEAELIGQKFTPPEANHINIEHPNSRIHQGNISHFKVEWNNRPVTIVAIHDITESKESARKLAESQKRYQELVEQLQEGIWLLNDKFETVFANPSLCRMFGRTINELAGKTLESLVTESAKQASNGLRANIQSGKQDKREMTFRKADGTEICTMITTSPVLDEKGMSKGALAAVQDITREKEFYNHQRLILNILSILNRHNEWKYLIRDILKEILRETGFSTVGIRLENKADNPYTEVSWKDDPAYDHSSEYIDIISQELQKHSPVFLYDLVLNQRTNLYPDNATSFGSFWTNNLDKFMQKTDKDHQDRYHMLKDTLILDQTMALIPVIVEGDVIGLLHLSDRKVNGLNRERLRFFEEIASTVSIAFKRMQAEQDLVIERNRATDYFNLAPVLMLVLGRDQCVKQINRMGCIILEGNEKDIVGKNWFDHFIPGDIREDLRTQYIDLVDSADNFTNIMDFFPEGYNHELLTMNGKKRTLSWHNTLLLDQKGNVTGTLSSAEDLTEKLEAEEARKQSEDKFFKIFRYNPDAIGIVNLADSSLKDANEALLDMFGYSREELFDPSFDSSQLWINRKDRDAVLALVLKEGQASAQEIRFRNKAGRELISLSSFQIIQLEGEQHILCIFRDITERRNLEDHLRQAQKMEAIGTLAGGIAHDFNNILSVIMGYAELAMSSIPENSRALRDMKEVISGSARAKELVQQILTFSRETEQKKAPLKPSTIIKEAMKMLRASIPSTIAIHSSLNSKQIVLADPTQMHQIIMNLCTNAFHAMEDTGGNINIQLSDVPYEFMQDTLKPKLKPGCYVKLTISDTGPGIPEDLRERIFEPYFTTKKKGKGTGLGLAIVAGIVKNHGGGIHLESKKGEGTIFDIYFPAYEGEAEIDSGQIVQNDIETTPAKILFVDDEIAIVKLHEKHLRKKGYQVESTSSSIEALEWIQKEPDRFDLVITDLTMPKMTGIELAKRTLQVQPKLPIIMCTGYTEKLTPDDIKYAGIKELMFKPVIMSDLIKTIEKCLNRNSMRQEN